jgi:hypothetical protein
VAGFCEQGNELLLKCQKLVANSYKLHFKKTLHQKAVFKIYKNLFKAKSYIKIKGRIVRVECMESKYH